MERILSRISDQKFDECFFKACQSWGVVHLEAFSTLHVFWSSVSNDDEMMLNNV